VLVVCHEVPIRYAVNAAAGSDDLDGPFHDVENAATRERWSGRLRGSSASAARGSCVSALSRYATARRSRPTPCWATRRAT
jgi:hypothetical protein